MRILVTNDDGYNAPGLISLVKALVAKKTHELYLVAPAEHMSGKSHSLTITKPIKYEKIEIEGVKEAYKLDGTPVDCVKFAIYQIFKGMDFDLIISGINNGCNIGIDVNYSGTFAAAHEGQVQGFNSIALSLENNKWVQYFEEDFKLSAQYSADFIDNIPESQKPYFYNINFPQDVDKIELVATRNVIDNKHERIVEISAGSGEYSYTHKINSALIDANSEYNLIKSGKATIVPIKLEYNDYATLDVLKKIIK